MVLVKDGVSESGTICDEEGEEEEGQNTILRLDYYYLKLYIILSSQRDKDSMIIKNYH